jgi:hypothetical protein
MSSARSFRSGSGALSESCVPSLGEEQLMDELTPEQEEAVAATVGVVQRIAMAVVELPPAAPKDALKESCGRAASRSTSWSS